MAGREFRVPEGRRVRLKEFATDATPGYSAREESEKDLAQGLERLRELQRATRAWLRVTGAEDAE